MLGRHPLLFFFLIAFAGAWLVEAPVVLSRTGTGLLPFTIPGPLPALMLAAATFTGPTLSAFVMTGVVDGRAGVHRLLRRYVQWRVKLRWYLFILLVIPASELLGALVLPGVAASYQPPTLSMALSYPAAFAATFVLGGPLGRRARLARLCPAPSAAAARPAAGKRPPGRAVGIVAPTPVLEWGVDTAHHPQYRHVHRDDHRFDRGDDVGVQQREGQPAHHHVDARVLQHVRQQGRGTAVPRPPPGRVRALPELVGFGVLAVIVVAVTRGRLGYGNYRPEERSPATALLT